MNQDLRAKECAWNVCISSIHTAPVENSFLAETTIIKIQIWVSCVCACVNKRVNASVKMCVREYECASVNMSCFSI